MNVHKSRDFVNKLFNQFKIGTITVYFEDHDYTYITMSSGTIYKCSTCNIDAAYNLYISNNNISTTSYLYAIISSVKKYRLYNGQIIEDTNASGITSCIPTLDDSGKIPISPLPNECPVVADWQGYQPWLPEIKPKCECGISKILSLNKEQDTWERHSNYCPIYTSKHDFGKKEDGKKGSSEDTWF